MLLLSLHEAGTDHLSIVTDGRGRQYSRRRMSWGLAGSALLHSLVALLLIFGLPDVRQRPPIEAAIPVDLVRAGEPTASPPEPQKALTPKVMPEATVPSPKPAPQAEAPLPTSTIPRAANGVRIDPLADISPPPKPRAQVLGTGEHLRRVKIARHPAPLPPAETAASAGPPAEDIAIGTDLNARGPATYDVKDLIRTQIERRWNFDVGASAAADFSVSIHLVVDPDGTIDSADILPDPRFASDRTFHELAISARDAALVSSPLQLPAGALSGPDDMVLKFSPHDVLR
jgi:hypothetical protein